jgi:DNA-binding protein HU-beta
MNKQQLINLLSDAESTTKADAERMLNSVLTLITSVIASGEEMKLIGFGTFIRAKRKARNGRNPKTGEPMKIEACYYPKFRPGEKFKEIVK